MSSIAQPFHEAAERVDIEDKYGRGEGPFTLEENRLHRKRIRESHQVIRDQFETALAQEYASHLSPPQQQLLFQQAWQDDSIHGYRKVESRYQTLLVFVDQLLSRR